MASHVCDQTRPLLSAMVDGEEALIRRAAIEEHLRSCAPCRQWLAQLESLRELSRAALPFHRAPDVLVRELQHQCGGDRSAVNGWASFWRPFGLGAAAVAGMVLATWLALFLFPGPEKYVYHVVDGRSATQALGNIAFHRKASPRARIVVVTHNTGVDFLLKDARDPQGRPYAAQVDGLIGQGVEFRVCNNTLLVRHIPASRVIAGARIVPSGIAEVGRLQSKEGFSYLKP